MRAFLRTTTKETFRFSTRTTLDHLAEQIVGNTDLKPPCVFTMGHPLKDIDRPHVNLNENTSWNRIEADSVGVLLQTYLQGLKISMLLPVILSNPIVLQMNLKGTPYEDAAMVVRNYLRKLVQFEEDTRTTVSEDLVLKLEEETLRLADYFIHNSDMLQYLPDWSSYYSSYDRKLLSNYENLINISYTHICESVLHLCIKERFLNELFQRKKDLRATVIENAKNINLSKISIKWLSKVRDFLILKYIKEVNAESSYGEEIMCEAARKLKYDEYTILKELKKKLLELNVELETKKTENANNRLAFAKDLKKVKEEETKYLIQLESLIHKYDTTLFEKHKEYIELQETFDRLSAEHDEFMKIYRREEKIYDEIVGTRRRAEQAEFLAKVDLFAMHHAAIKIQRFYRQYMKKVKKEMLQKKAEAAKGKLKGRNVSSDKEKSKEKKSKKVKK